MTQQQAFSFRALAALVLFSLGSCTNIPNLAARQETAALAAPEGYERRIMRTHAFDLLSYTPSAKMTMPEMTVFIEGDGFSWESKTRVSDDPTPITQTVLSLMTTSERRDTVYIARPCQFVGATSRGCSPAFWTGARYNEDVIASLDEALSALRNEYNTQSFTLIGYSGGGTVATLLAARRADVSALITLAAPLDILAFTEHHAVAPMAQSMNPLAAASALSDIPQIHIFGERDEVVPASLIDNYLNALAHTNCTQTFKVTADHWAGWTEHQPRLTDMKPTCKTDP